MRPALRLLALAPMLALSLAACGKKGPPSPPGPPEKIIYPMGYPKPEPFPAPPPAEP